MTNFQEARLDRLARAFSVPSPKLLVQFLVEFQRFTFESVSSGWNIFGYPILVIDTGCQEREKVLNRPTLWDLRRFISLFQITNIVLVKEIGGNPCVMGASLVWPKDVASVGIVSVQEGYQVGFQTVVNVRMCGDSHTSS